MTEVLLTNVERRDDVQLLLDRYKALQRPSFEVLDDDEREQFRAGDAPTQQRLFYRMLCYGALAAQPAPEAVVVADWRRYLTAGVIDAVFDGAFELARFATAPPVSRADSRGKIVDFVRLSETRDFWSRLLPAPPDGAEVVDLLYACSGGSLKSRAFWVVREMVRGGMWPYDGLRRSSCVADGRVRKRAARMGLVDLPEHADTIDDMKAFSAALTAAFGLAGNGARDHGDLPLSTADVRCETCDQARMAACPIPHCLYRRVRLEGAA